MNFSWWMLGFFMGGVVCQFVHSYLFRTHGITNVRQRHVKWSLLGAVLWPIELSLLYRSFRTGGPIVVVCDDGSLEVRAAEPEDPEAPVPDPQRTLLTPDELAALHKPEPFALVCPQCGHVYVLDEDASGENFPEAPHA